MVNELFNGNGKGKEPLDQEWVDLILEAIDAGISVQEIQQFLQGSQVKTI